MKSILSLKLKAIVAKIINSYEYYVDKNGWAHDDDGNRWHEGGESGSYDSRGNQVGGGDEDWDDELESQYDALKKYLEKHNNNFIESVVDYIDRKDKEPSGKQKAIVIKLLLKAKMEEEAQLFGWEKPEKEEEEIDNNLLKELKSHIKKGNTIEFEYTAKSGRKKDYIVEPIKTINRDEILVATHNGIDKKFFIKNLENIEETKKPIDENIIKALENAIKYEEGVEFEYTKKNGQKKKYQVLPIRILRDKLLANDHDTEKQFFLNQIDNVQPLEFINEERANKF